MVAIWERFFVCSVWICSGESPHISHALLFIHCWLSSVITPSKLVTSFSATLLFCWLSRCLNFYYSFCMNIFGFLSVLNGISWFTKKILSTLAFFSRFFLPFYRGDMRYMGWVTPYIAYSILLFIRCWLSSILIPSKLVTSFSVTFCFRWPSRCLSFNYSVCMNVFGLLPVLIDIPWFTKKFCQLLHVFPFSWFLSVGVVGISGRFLVVSLLIFSGELSHVSNFLILLFIH